MTRTRTSRRPWQSDYRNLETFRLRDGTIYDLLRSFSRQTGELTMLRKITTMALIGAALAMTACNTVRGAASDVNSAANAVDNAT
jgi:predicted small secreted protein